MIMGGYKRLAVAFCRAWLKDRCPVCEKGILELFLALVPLELRKECITRFEQWHPELSDYAARLRRDYT